MDKDYTKLTIRDFRTEFPKLYADCYGDFSPKKEWNELLWKLSEALANISDGIQASQVISKFGKLRYSVCIPAELDEETIQRIHRLIHEAEALTL